ncbi:thiamine pyrophosphate-dependent enzyme [Priestia megaterium]
MGHAIGYAIGAKIASPHKPIVCLTGDGCTLMHGTEIATAVNESIAVIFIVFNNGGLDMVDKGMKQWLNRSVGAKYKEKTNIKKFAESLGAIAYRCRNKSEIEDAIRQTLEYKTIPSVIEVIVDPNEIPPILNRV